MFLIFVEINECESNPCPENDNCADLIDGYSCVPKGIYQTIIKNSPFSIHLKMIVYTKVSGFPAGKSAGPVWEKVVTFAFTSSLHQGWLGSLLEVKCQWQMKAEVQN